MQKFIKDGNSTDISKAVTDIGNNTKLPCDARKYILNYFVCTVKASIDTSNGRVQTSNSNLNQNQDYYKLT
jgi:hypothetical protein